MRNSARSASRQQQVPGNELGGSGDCTFNPKRILLYCAAVVLVLLTYAYPALRTRSQDRNF